MQVAKDEEMMKKETRARSISYLMSFSPLLSVHVKINEESHNKLVIFLREECTFSIVVLPPSSK
jgi:hypothetical protein